LLALTLDLNFLLMRCTLLVTIKTQSFVALKHTITRRTIQAR
jgi:hypothetical protein